MDIMKIVLVRHRGGQRSAISGLHDNWDEGVWPRRCILFSAQLDLFLTPAGQAYWGEFKRLHSPYMEIS